MSEGEVTLSCLSIGGTAGGTGAGGTLSPVEILGGINPESKLSPSKGVSKLSRSKSSKKSWSLVSMPKLAEGAKFGDGIGIGGAGTSMDR